jgi:iron(III) transport system permease protein
MRLPDLSRDKTVWVGSVVVLLLLTLLPFSSPPEGMLAALQEGNRAHSFWTQMENLPLLKGMFALLLVNIVVALFGFRKRLRARLLLGLNLLGVLLFVLQFVFLSPEVRLGVGSFVLFFAFLLFLSQALSRLGLVRGDAFISGSILSIAVLLIIFIIFPLVVILARSVVVDGSLRPANFVRTLTAYPSTWRIVKNSLLMASSVGVFSTLVGLAFALVIERSRFRYKRLMQGFSILPIITPPFVIGLAIIFMLGRSGFVTHGIFGLEISSIFGYPGIVLAQTLSFAPMAYLILSGVVQSLDAALEEASYTLGAGRWHSFKTVIWPLIRPGLANAFLLSVIESLADFANPILLGGDFDVLATSIYLAIIGRYDEMLAASLGIVLLAITLTTFIVQRYWVGKRSYVTVTGKPSRYAALPLP